MSRFKDMEIGEMNGALNGINHGTMITGDVYKHRKGDKNKMNASGSYNNQIGRITNVYNYNYHLPSIPHLLYPYPYSYHPTIPPPRNNNMPTLVIPSISETKVVPSNPSPVLIPWQHTQRVPQHLQVIQQPSLKDLEARIDLCKKQIEEKNHLNLQLMDQLKQQQLLINNLQEQLKLLQNLLQNNNNNLLAQQNNKKNKKSTIYEQANVNDFVDTSLYPKIVKKTIRRGRKRKITETETESDDSYEPVGKKRKLALVEWESDLSESGSESESETGKFAAGGSKKTCDKFVSD